MAAEWDGMARRVTTRRVTKLQNRLPSPHLPQVPELAASLGVAQFDFYPSYNPFDLRFYKRPSKKIPTFRSLQVEPYAFPRLATILAV